MTELLEVRDLRVDFPLPGGVLHAVDGASFELRAGEALGIVGESGSGKTVSVLTLMRLLPPNARVTSGQVLLDGTDRAEHEGVVTGDEAELRQDEE